MNKVTYRRITILQETLTDGGALSRKELETITGISYGIICNLINRYPEYFTVRMDSLIENNQIIGDNTDNTEDINERLDDIEATLGNIETKLSKINTDLTQLVESRMGDIY